MPPKIIQGGRLQDDVSSRPVASTAGLDDNVVVPYSDTGGMKDTLSIPKRCSTAVRLIGIFVQTICED
jgi:hypothetical protein